MMRSELGESWEHFLAAATHAANGVGHSVGPRAVKLKGAASTGWSSTAAALAPLAAAYREGAADATAVALKQQKKRAHTNKKGKPVSNRRTGMLIGLLAAGVALGAAGALVVRRRRRQEWSEYDPTGALDSMSADTRSMADKTGGKMDKLAHHTSKAMDKTADKLSSAASSMRKTDFKGKADEAAERANEATDKMPSKFGGSSSQNSRP